MYKVNGKQVRLRSWQKKDIFALAQLADDYEIAKNLRNSFPHPYSVVDAQKWVSYNLAQAEPNPIKAIDYNGSLVGCVGAFIKDDVYEKNAEIGYWIGRQYWGMGIATTAVSLLTDYIFNNFSINRLYAEVFDNNEVSQKVLMKNGYVLEAIHKDLIYKDGLFYDAKLFVRLRSNWIQCQKNN